MAATTNAGKALLLKLVRAGTPEAPRTLDVIVDDPCDCGGPCCEETTPVQAKLASTAFAGLLASQVSVRAASAPHPATIQRSVDTSSPPPGYSGKKWTQLSKKQQKAAWANQKEAENNNKKQKDRDEFRLTAYGCYNDSECTQYNAHIKFCHNCIDSGGSYLRWDFDYYRNGEYVGSYSTPCMACGPSGVSLDEETAKKQISTTMYSVVK
ncbi:hypothetical protein [Polyangium sp. 6x1]|uniref:hypothetical protein n=1 Tax=Polyangium sp. 6x1 TaxID=3042689 RepID=UPI0024831755|nr:hypothetical protein [Polyangium sp. 6x1]MDI1451243.1 hypothetical protein [Polyangium sp. 6x1]